MEHSGNDGVREQISGCQWGREGEKGRGGAVLEGSARGTPAVGMLSALTVRGAATCHRNRIGWPGTKQTHHRHR